MNTCFTPTHLNWVNRPASNYVYNTARPDASYRLGVSFLSLALSSMSLNDLFFFSALRGGVGNGWFSRGSLFTSSQIRWSSSLTRGTCVLYVIAMTGVVSLFVYHVIGPGSASF